MIRCCYCGRLYARYPKPEEKPHVNLMRALHQHMLKMPAAPGIHAECIMKSYTYLSARNGNPQTQG